jgi:hypothetical protein
MLFAQLHRACSPAHPEPVSSQGSSPTDYYTTWPSYVCVSASTVCLQGQLLCQHLLRLAKWLCQLFHTPSPFCCRCVLPALPPLLKTQPSPLPCCRHCKYLVERCAAAAAVLFSPPHSPRQTLEEAAQALGNWSTTGLERLFMDLYQVCCVCMQRVCCGEDGCQICSRTACVCMLVWSLWWGVHVLFVEILELQRPGATLHHDGPLPGACCDRHGRQQGYRTCTQMVCVCMHRAYVRKEGSTHTCVCM